MSILDILSPYKLVAEIAVIGGLACGAAYGIHMGLEHERDIGRNEVRAEYAKQLQEAKDAAHQRETELTAQRDKAIENAQIRDQTIQSLAARAGVSSNGLRDTIAALGVSMSSATADALRQTASTYGKLLAACDGEQRSMAKDVDDANNDKRTLIEAWPRNAPAKP